MWCQWHTFCLYTHNFIVNNNIKYKERNRQYGKDRCKTAYDNVFETIDKEWLLVCSGDKDNFNMMTASWGCLGWLWNKPVAVVFIRPERHTHELIEKNDI